MARQGNTELLMMSLNLKGRKFTNKATVTEVVDEFGWNYLSCPICKSKVSNGDIDFWCNKCNDDVSLPVTRYRIKMEIQDDTDKAYIVAFDKDAESLIGYPITKLCDVANQENGEQKVWDIIHKMIGKETIFQIKIKEYDMRKGNNTFTASKIFTASIDSIDKPEKGKEETTTTNSGETEEECVPETPKAYRLKRKFIYQVIRYYDDI